MRCSSLQCFDFVLFVLFLFPWSLFRQYLLMHYLLCISTSERMLAHALTWLKKIKNAWKLSKKYFFSSYARETHIRLTQEHMSRQKHIFMVHFQTFFVDFRREITEKGLKWNFEQLLGAHSTLKLVEIHNTRWLSNSLIPG